jgi:hypothetical protein
MQQAMRIGVDFDNTLCDYDQVFVAAAKTRQLIDAGFIGSKQAVRNHIRQSPGGEIAWQRLQGHVYGSGIAGAFLFDGVGEFLMACRHHGCDVFVVSHKTQFGHYDPQRVDLRQAALGWMGDHGFFDEARFGLHHARVFFENTRAAKLKRIRSIGCTHFIDDLIEVFTDAGFPQGVHPILFSAVPGAAEELPGATVCPTWRHIAKAIFANNGRD